MPHTFECLRDYPNCICNQCENDCETVWIEAACCMRHEGHCCGEAECPDFVPEDKKSMNGDYDIARRAVQIVAGKLREAGGCKYASPLQCRRAYVPAPADCVNCLERWLLLKAQKQIIRERK